MRVATTSHGHKIHLIDQSRIKDPPHRTACGRKTLVEGFINTPKAKEVCQVCARSIWVRIGRLRTHEAKVEVTRGDLSPENPAQQEIEQLAG